MSQSTCTVGPIDAGERLGSLDFLRGIAVLGILAMNIRNLALPLTEFDNPRWPRDDSGALAPADLWLWLTTNTLLEDKMITIFGLLFGAGLILFWQRVSHQRPDRQRSSPTWLHLRRMWWLLLIGLLHAYALWYGDILNTYAICGLLVWPLRRLHAGWLIGLGVCVLLGAVWFRVGPAMWDALVREPGSPPRAPTLTRQIMGHAVRTEADAHAGGWLDLATWRASLNTAWHFLAGATFSWWRSAGHMLIGMGLMKLGLFSATPTRATLTAIALPAYALGLTLTLVGMGPSIADTLARAPDLGPASGVVGRLAFTMRFIGALAVALGHIALALALWRWMSSRGTGRTLRAALESVGRLALTNYLMHTLVCVAIFDGWAGAQWGRWTFTQMYALVAAVWIAQLILSPLWLRRFSMGPVEWAWRSLTYRRVAPILRHDG